MRSEQASSALLLGCTLLALALANSSLGADYVSFWRRPFAGMSIEHWINDALMAVFFLLIGLELERELYVGELSEPRKALLPIVAAIGGMIAPAALHYLMNAGTNTQGGFGIPMATDIAFALGVLALLRDRIPPALKVFVVAFAVMDDLGAIVIIATFYTVQLSIVYLVAAIVVWLLLVGLNRFLRIMALTPYLLGGALMWFCMLQSGVHATIAGVLLAFAVPFTRRDGVSPSHRLEHALHKPVAFVILPIFALANAGVMFPTDWQSTLTSANSAGIAAGLIVGKPLGVTLCCAMAVMLGVCRLPVELRWAHVVGAGLLGGIGFTMSIFITNLAFGGDQTLANASKIAVLFASILSGVLGFLWLRFVAPSDTSTSRSGA